MTPLLYHCPPYCLSVEVLIVMTLTDCVVTSLGSTLPKKEPVSTARPEL